MRLFLDDERFPPDDGNEWLIVRTAEDCIEFLKANHVTYLSLDHDLGMELDGMDVLVWLEDEAALNPSQHIPETMVVHSMNPYERNRMEMVIEKIKKMIDN